MGKVTAKAGKKLATNVLKIPARALEIGANVVTAAASRNPKAASSTLPEVINFYHTAKVSIWDNLFKFLYYKWTKNVIDYTQPLH